MAGKEPAWPQTRLPDLHQFTFSSRVICMTIRRPRLFPEIRGGFGGGSLAAVPICGPAPGRAGNHGRPARVPSPNWTDERRFVVY